MRHYKNFWQTHISLICISIASFIFIAITIKELNAHAYIFASETNGTDIVTHPIGYTGTGGILTVTVGIDPTSANASQMVTSTINTVFTWTDREPTLGNLVADNVPFFEYDFEAVLVHEMGHSLGLAHVNAATESGLTGSNQNYTKATNGINNIFDINDGTDNIIGSADDVRGDDVNLHWYNKNLNNPFTISSTVDSTTYQRATTALPTGDLFVANADRTVASLYGAALRTSPYGELVHLDSILTLDTDGGTSIATDIIPPQLQQLPDGSLFWPGSSETIGYQNPLQRLFFADSSEAVMQQGTFNGEAQRELGHNDVAGILYAMAGIDEIAGTADDYDLRLEYVGLTTNADIVIDFDNTQTGFAVSQSNGNLLAANHAVITVNSIFFNTTAVTWFFNPNYSCMPTAISDLSVTANGNNADLAWTAPAKANKYEVWSGINDPYFTPGDDCGAAGNCTTINTTTTTDLNALGDASQNNSYVILGTRNGCPAPAADSNRVGTFAYDIKPST